MKIKKLTNKWSIQLSKDYRDILKKYCKENKLSMSGYIETLINKNIPKKKVFKKSEFYTTFEPKITNRFIVYIKNDNGESILPSYVIKSINRPNYVLENGSLKPNNFKLTCYDPIVPSVPQMIMSSIEKSEKWNMIVNILGPVGDKVEEWEIKGAKINSIKFSDLDWQNKGDPLEIEITLNFDWAKLNY